MPGQVFVSHSTAHRDLTERAVAVLTAAGFTSPFVSFDPETGIRAGSRWEREVYRALNACDAVVALNTPGWRTSRWCFAEMTMARSLGKPLIVIRTDPGAPDERTGTADLLLDLQWLTVAADDAEAGRLLTDELVRSGVRARRTFVRDPGRSPYPGLAPLDVADAAVFFGRDQQAREVIDLLERAVAYGDARMVTIVGVSGSGKSSLLRAGVVARLRDHEGWEVCGPLTPRSDVAAEVRRALAVPRGERRLLVALDQIDEFLARPERLLHLLAELFAMPAGDVLVVGTVRWNANTEFEAALGPLRDRVTRFVLGQVARSGQRDIIREPARLAGVHVADDLVERLLDEMAERETLPLLAVTLRTLWDHRTPDGLTLDAYRARGGLEGSVARAVDGVLAVNALTADEEGELRTALLAMVQVDRNGELSPRPVRLDALTGRLRQVLRGFVAEGLLRTGRDGADAVELAHRSLIDMWPRLRGWVDAERETLIRVGRLEGALTQWRDDPRVRLSGVNLVEAEELLGTGHPVALDARALVEASVADRVAAERREFERIRALDVGESLRLAVQARELADREPETALLLAGEAMARDRNALTETVFREALSHLPAPTKTLAYLPSARIAVVDGGLAAARDGYSPAHWDVEGRLLARPASSGRCLAMAAVPGTDRIVGLGPDGLRLLTLAGQELSVLAIEGADRAQYRTLRATANGVVVVHLDRWVRLIRIEGDALVPDGELDLSPDPAQSRFGASVFQAVPNRDAGLLLVQRRGVSAEVWTRHGHRLLSTSLPGDPLPVSGEFLADDGFVVGTSQGGIALWPELGGPPRILSERAEGSDDAAVRAVTADGRLVAMSETDRDVLRVFTAGGDEVAAFVPHTGAVNAVAFSADGHHLATGGVDRTIAVWELPGCREVVRLTGHDFPVSVVRFLDASPAKIVSLDLGGYLRWWDPFVSMLPDLVGPVGPLTGLGVDADGITGANAAETWLWRGGLPTGERVAVRTPRPYGLPDRVVHARSPDRTTEVAVAQNGAVTVTSADGRTLGVRRTTDEHYDEVRSVAIDPRGEFIALGRRGDVLLLDWTAQDVRTVPVDGYKVEEMAFSADGSRLITAANDPHGSARFQITDRDGRRIAGLDPDRSFSPSFTLAPRDTFVCLWQGSVAMFFDLDGSELGRLDGGTGVNIQRVAVAADGSLFAAAFDDDVVRIWGLEEGREVQRLPVVAGATCLAFDHRTHRLLVGTPEGPLRQYALDVLDLLPAAAVRTSRSALDAQDGRRFALDAIRFDLSSRRAEPGFPGR